MRQQAIRIPAAAFATSACQVVYLGSPDLSTSTVHVDFLPAAQLVQPDPAAPAPAACGRGQQLFYAYTDGFKVPIKASGAMRSPRPAAWGAAITLPPDPNAEAEAAEAEAAAKADADAAAAAAAAGGGSAGGAAGGGGAGADGGGGGSAGAGAQRRRRRLQGFGLPLVMSSFGSDWDYARNVIDGAALLEAVRHNRPIGTDISGFVPGPGGPLATPVMPSTGGQLQLAGRAGEDPVIIPADFTNVYSAPEADCRALMDGSGGGAGHAAADAAAAAVAAGSNARSRTVQDSCFVTQLVVYVYDNCTATAARAAAAAAKARARAAGRSGAPSPPGAPTLARAGDCVGQNYTEECMLNAFLKGYSNAAGYVDDDGFVQVSVQYKPYYKCYSGTLQRLAKGADMIRILSWLVLGALLLVLLPPTVFRLFIEFPARGIRHGCSKLFALRASTASASKPLPLADPQLLAHKARWRVLHGRRTARLRRLASYGFCGLCWVRKQLLYAVCSVHSSDGQYRGLQVSIISNAVLIICFAAFPPSTDPPLDIYLPPIALKISKSETGAMKVIVFLINIVLMSTYLGLISYLAMLANYNTPRSRFYPVQCCISGFFLMVLDAFVVIQIASTIVYWPTMDPPWPYLPLLVAQIANFIVSNVLMVVICFSRQDTNDVRAEAEYQACLEGLRRAEAAAAAKALKKKLADGSLHGSDSQDEPSGRIGARAVAESLLRGQGSADAAEQAAATGSPKAPAGLPWGSEAEGAEEAAGGIRDRSQAGGSGGGSGGGGSGGGGSGGGGAQLRQGSWAAEASGGAELVVEGEGASAADVDAAKAVVRVAPEYEEAGAEAEAEGRPEHRGRALLRRAFGGLREDAAFRFPPWLVAALLVSTYMLFFMYARAMTWSHQVEKCLAEPADCISRGVSRYIVFASRIPGLSYQRSLLSTLDEVLASREVLQEALAGSTEDLVGIINNSSVIAAALADSGVAAGLAVASTAAAAAASAVVLGYLGSSLNNTVAGDALGLLSANQTAALQAGIASAISAQLTSINLTAALLQPAGAVFAQSASTAAMSLVDPVYTALASATDGLRSALRLQDKVLGWKDGLTTRWTYCSAVGFTLGLLLGLSSLLQTAVSFRTAVRKIRLTAISRRIFQRVAETEEVAKLVQAAAAAGTAGGGTAAAAAGSRAQARAAAAAARERWSANLALLDDPNSLVNRASGMNIANVVFFFGVLLSTAVVQLYVVGIALSIGMAIVTHPWTYTYLIPNYWLWIVALAAAGLLNKILTAYVGGSYLSDGDAIHRPAAFLAFLVIVSATNLVIGILLAVIRIVLLLATTIFALGKIDVTLFTLLPILDLPHNAFLAGLHLHESMTRFGDPCYLPGPRGEAYRRWRRLRDVVRQLSADELRELLYTEEEGWTANALAASAPPAVMPGPQQRK